ncbi:circadian-associated transcriptional repressor [Balearica regulorum gibbericeps]|uniref:circadian-associated transcriptional repressor n=1 Tax=Balearica regulorum gibbericeps TaxID=100784 RepID=UPI003F5F627E
MGERGGRGPAGGTCGRARVRVGPPQPGRNRRRHRSGNGDTGTGTAAPRHWYRDTGIGTGTAAPPQLQPGAGSLGPAAPQGQNSGRGSPGGAPPAMEPPARSCSCGSPASSPGGPSDSEAEGGGHPQEPPKPERSRKRTGGSDRAPPESSPAPRGGKRPRKGEGGDTPPSDGDRIFAQKCRELRGFIRPLAELLEGLKRGRYDRGLSSFQQSVAMDRIQRIIGVLQKPEMGARYLGTLLQVEGMLRVWFPHVAPKAAQDPAPASALLPHRRRPPAGPPGAPRCRRLPGDTPAAAGTSGTSHRGGRPKCQRPAQTGTPASPPAPDE